MSNRPKWAQRILDYEDARLGIAVAWLVGVPLWALAGFYLGTILDKRWIIDYQIPDMVRGGYGALVGLLVGILFAIVVTVVYPPVVEADALAGIHEEPID